MALIIGPPRKELRTYFDEITNDVIQKATGQSDIEDEVRDEQHQVSYQ